MSEAVEVLGRVADLPPGPELAAALSDLYLPEVPNGRVIDVLRAQSRQLAHDQARLLATMVEVSRCTPPAEADDADGRPRNEADESEAAVRDAEAYEWASGEIAAALTWTGAATDRELHFAEVLAWALPEVLAELWEGRIDRARAWVFAQYLDPAHGELSIAQIRALGARFVPLAPGLTSRQLAGRLMRAILAIDPGYARRRYRRAVRERGVAWYLDRSGTATLAGSGLSPQEVVAAGERLDRLAAAVKRAGHPGRLGQITADLFVGMLDGRYAGLSEDEIIALLLADGPRPEDTGAGAGAGTDTACVSDREAGRGTGSDGDRRAGGGNGGDMPGPGGPATPGGSGPSRGPDGAGAAPSAGLREGVEVRVGLSTLIGLDELPGEIPGLGPVIADVARATVTGQHRGAEWRFAVTDAEGYLLLAGVTRRRPYPGPVGAARSRGGVVELHVPAAVLAELAADPGRCGPWAGIVADLAGQHARRDQLAGDLDRRPGARFARAALARHVQVRDRCCCHPGCGRPARKSELDHTRDHHHGGPTVAGNIGPGCWRHHPFKHGLGWQLSQPEPGRFVWRSPLGQVYRTRGEPISPPTADPRPRADEPDDTDVPPGRAVDLPILWSRPPDETRAQPPPRRDQEVEDPPF